MKAIVFAAGLGTRLGAFTKEHPKALVEIGGVPMLERVLLKLRAAGIEEAVVNVHHFAGQIIDFLESRGNLGMRIHVSHESELLLETGGGILAAARYLCGDEPVLVHNSDILTDFPIAEMAACHKSSEAEATLLVAERDTSRYLLLDDSMEMQGWTNIATGDVRPDASARERGTLRRAFGGVHVVSPSMFGSLKRYNDMLVSKGAEADSRGLCRFSIMNFYIDTCRDSLFKGFEPSAPYMWCDIGKPESVERAQKMICGLRDS